MRFRFVTILTCLVCIAGCGPSSNTPKPAHPQLLPNEKIPLGRLSGDVVPLRYRLALTVDPSKDVFSGHAEIDVEFRKKKQTIFLHGNHLNVLGASVRLSAKNSIPAHYMQVDKSGVARLLFVDEVPAGKATIVFDYEAHFGRSLSGLYKVVDRGDAYAFTQFESTSAREAFPSFDEPRFKSPFQISVVAPSADKVVSNAPVLSAKKAAQGLTNTTFQWTKPLPTYLVALAVGPLDIVDGGEVPANQYRHRALHIRGIAARGQGDRIRYALSLTPRIVTALEDYFGIGYPFDKLDIVAVPDFAAGAMENAGMITFRERYLLIDTNAPLDQKRSSLSVQAHELTHQWFGDLVTPSWWDDTWLNESFATWMEYKIAAQVAPDEQFETDTLRGGLQVMDLDELPSAREIRQPVRTNYEIENAFDDITYDKGASVLSMFEDFVGPDSFQRGIRNYLTKFAYRNATADDFVGAVADATVAHAHNEPEEVTIRIDRTGAIFWNDHRVPNEAAVIDQMSHMAASISKAQVTRAFRSFIDQPGIPFLQVRTKCDDVSAFAHLTQSLYVPIGRPIPSRRWSIPACLSGAGGEKICRLVDRPAVNVLLGAKCPDALLPNVEGKGYYRFAFDEPGWQPLVRSAARLDPADQIELLYDLSAALHAGRAQASDLLAAIRLVGPAARWDVLASIDNILRGVRVQALSSSDIGNYRSFVAGLFGARMTQLGFDARTAEPPAETLAREHLATLMVTEARAPSVISALSKSADGYLDGTGTLAPEILGDAFRAGLISQGAPFADRLINLFRTTDQESVRRKIVYAFAGSDDPAVIGKLLAVALTPSMRTGEIRYLYQYMSQEPVAKNVLWNWYKGNFKALLARVSSDGMIGAVGILNQACDVQARSDLEQFFSRRTAMLTGTARPLAEAEERIDRCIAFRSAKAGEIAAALHAAAVPGPRL